MALGYGRLYAVTFTAVTVSAAQDLFYLKPAADKPIWLEHVKIAVVGGTADAADAQEELLDIRVARLTATVTVGSGGGAFTPLPIQASDTAAGFTARINDTTIATTSGAIQVLDADMMNNRVGYQYLPAPEHRAHCVNAAALVVRLTGAPADALSVSGTALVRELG
jgi:hypothetical protein